MEFGVVGYNYGDPKPTSITFFIDGTTKVSDHRGNGMKEYTGPHAAVVQQLKEAGVDWQKLASAGFPQLPYAELAELPMLPPTPLDELMRIPVKALRVDALRARREADEAVQKELELAEAE